MYFVTNHLNFELLKLVLMLLWEIRGGSNYNNTVKSRYRTEYTIYHTFCKTI